MKSHRDFFQALLEGNVLIDPGKGDAVVMDDDGMLRIGDRSAEVCDIRNYMLYEIKPTTISVGSKAFSVPTPYRFAPPETTPYFALEDNEGICNYDWADDSTDRKLLASGLAFRTMEDAELAIEVRQEIFAELMKGVVQ